MGQQTATSDARRFGQYLRRIREERRLSLDAVEEMSLGLPERVTKSHLSRIENGRAVPSFPRMFTLSQIYGVPVSSMAERFELCLKAQMFPRAAAQRAIPEILDEAKQLRRAGRHGEALVLYESVVVRAEEIAEESRAGWLIDVKLECINCLAKLSREATAKEECEKLLSSPDLTPTQQVVTLQYFAMCCYRLAKFTVAMMAIEKADDLLAQLEQPGELTATLLALKGNLQANLGRFVEAEQAYRQALPAFEALANPFEACRMRLNLAACQIERGASAQARSGLRRVLKTAESAGYDRQRAYALSHLALLAYRENDIDAAESYCLRSNRLARSREYTSLLFRNCFYLWRIARERHDDPAVKTNERTLRTVLGRVEEYLPEAEEFRAFLGRGHHE